MKPKTRRKTKKIAILLPARVIRKSTRLVRKIVEATGIPEAYSDSVAWFAERMVLAGVCIAVASFAAGVLFVLRWSEPIADSQFYNVVTHKAEQAKESVAVYSQQIIDMASPLFSLLIKQNHNESELAAQQLAIRKEKLRAYLKSKNSPFADDDAALEAFVTSKNMKLMLAISFVESTFGQHCYFFNCSGIGGTPPNLRKYASYADWIFDFDKLLEQRYKNVAPEKFIGLYVQPGSPNWIYGVKKVLKEFETQGIEG